MDVYLHESSASTKEYLYKLYDAMDQSQTFLLKSLINIDGISMKSIDRMIEECFKEDVETHYRVNEMNYIEEIFKINKKEYDVQKKNYKIDKPSKINLEECHKVLDLEVTKQLLKEYTFANQRAKRICFAKDAPEFIQKLNKVCVKWIDDVVLDLSERILTLAQKMPNDPLKSIELLKGFMSLFSNVVNTVDTLQITIQEDVLQQLQFNYELFNQCDEALGSRIDKIERNICRAFETIIEWVATLVDKLMKYKNEFKFKDEMDDSWRNAPQCTLVMKDMCYYITSYIKLFDEHIKGMNHRNFMMLLGHRLFDVLIAGFKELKITPFSGGFLFMYDIRYIYEVVRLASFPTQIKYMFGNMTMLFKIYCIDKDLIPDIVRTIMDDGGFDFIEPNDMLKCRTDFTKAMLVDY